KRLTGGPPVLVTRISTWPNRSIVRRYQSSTAPAEETSTTTASASPSDSTSDRAFSSSEAERAQIETLQPSCANAIAQAFPRPFPAAATIATRSLIPRSIFTLLKKALGTRRFQRALGKYAIYFQLVYRSRARWKRRVPKNKKRWLNARCANSHLCLEGLAELRV